VQEQQYLNSTALFPSSSSTFPTTMQPTNLFSTLFFAMVAVEQTERTRLQIALEPKQMRIQSQLLTQVIMRTELNI
jgi:hypothetical protein